MYFSHIFYIFLRNMNLLLKINLPNLQSLQIRKSNVKHECEPVWQNRPDFVGSFVLSRQNYNNRTQIGKKVCMTLAEPESYCYMRIYRRKLAISYKTQWGKNPLWRSHFYCNKFLFSIWNVYLPMCYSYNTKESSRWDQSFHLFLVPFFQLFSADF